MHRTSWWLRIVVLAVFSTAGLLGCSDAPGGQDGAAGDGGAGDGADAARHDGSQPDVRPPIDCDAFTWPVSPAKVAITPASDWKTSLDATQDAAFFVKDKGGDLEWVKFTIFLSEPETVYFQDGKKYPFHFLFAAARLDPFSKATEKDFDAKTLHEAGQVAVLGAVVLSRKTQEYGVQLERREAYHPKMVTRLFASVTKALGFDSPHKAFYLPTFDQRAATEAARHCYAKEGIEISDGTRWAKQGGCYATGWALGKVVFIEGRQIDQAYQLGTLTYRDILVTDAVPAEIPHVAGIVAGTPSTPNSHVAILAQTFGVPFAYSAEVFKAAQALVGKEAILRVRGGCEIDIVEPLDMDAKTRAYLEGLKKTVSLTYPAIVQAGKISRPVAGLTAADVETVGGKAAGFGILHEAIPNDMPKPAIALTFDLYAQFMAQKLASGKTLQQTIDATLAGTTFPPDVKQLAAKLLSIRDTIKDVAKFSPTQRSAITALLAQAGFDPKRKIRFRSSTNVEDGAQFTGAGLYDSKSGCLADDTDADELGPSHCSAKKLEAGVFRAIRKVYASFYNDNAYLERLRHGVKESEVGMAILVHYSFPDPQELANGVLVYRHNGKYSRRVEISSQRGATSVTNPQPGVTPEVVSVNFIGGAPYASLFQYSSLPPLSKPVLDYPAEYEALAKLVDKVRVVWEKRSGTPGHYALDLEYKKVTPGKLVIKQVRFLPQPETAQTLTPVLVAAPTTLCPFQGENSDVYALHRLKSRWVLRSRTVMLDGQARGKSFYAGIDATLLDLAAGKTTSKQGDPAGWPAAAHAVTKTGVSDTFDLGSGTDKRTFTLAVNLPDKVSPRNTPIVLLKDLYLDLTVDYTTAVPFFDWTNKPSTRSSETVRLTGACPSDPAAPDDLEQTRNFAATKGLSVGIQFYWPPGPKGMSAGYTAPLVAWGKVTITGLTTTPLELSGVYSRTYRPGHHNFDERFALEPRLDPNTPAAALAELATKNVRTLIFDLGYAGAFNSARVIGIDGKLRDW